MEAPSLMVSVSGIRGIYGNGLSDDDARRYCHAFGLEHPGTVVIGRDSRVSGRAIAQAAADGLLAAGCSVIDLGIAATPTVEMAVGAKHAAGGVIVTASHNPGDWNGLKFLGPDGVFLNADQGARVLDRFRALGSLDGVPRTGTLSEWDGANAHHVDAILALDLIEPARIAAKGFSVCLDPNGGAGGPVCRLLLEKLGCRVTVINGEPDGVFAHGAEPVPENLGDLMRLVGETGADVGFAVDPDVDRLSLVDETGRAPGEEYSLALATDYLMAKGARVMACNLSTSRMAEDVAARHGGRIYRSMVGEINVVEKMREVGAPVGGEGNGGVILADLHHGRDAVLGIALTLQHLAERDLPLSTLVADIPRYVMLKEKLPVTGGDAWREKAAAAFADACIDRLDGIKVILPDSWVHIRPSNTEPIIRLMAEAPTEEGARRLIDRVRDALG